MTDPHIVGAALGSCTPPPLMLPSEFAEANLYLPASSNAMPGPIRLTKYQRGIVDTFVDPSIHTIALCCSAQTGKSLSVDALIGYVIACEPGPILHVNPTENRSLDFVRDRLDPLIKASPALRDLVGGGRKGGGDSLSHKMFAGGSINFASSYKADDLAARAIRYVFLDEVDRFANSAGTEGDPVSLAIARAKTYPNRRIVLVSTPTSRIGSRIASWFERGDQRRWFCPCPACNTFAVLSFDNLIWKPAEPQNAMMVCMDCGHHASELERRAMIAAGEWRSTAEGETGLASFHLSELSSPFSSLESVARQYDAADSPDKKRTFYNTCLGETFDSDAELNLNAGDLEARAETIAAPYAANIVGVTAGIDVQGNRVEATFLAHHDDATFSVLNHIVLPGDTSAPQVWGDLDQALGQTFPLRDGRVLPIAAIALDSGFSSDNVYSFCLTQRRKSRRCFPIKGKSGFNEMAIKQGAKVKGNMHLQLVGVDGVKMTVAKRLMIEHGPGFIRLPNHLDSAYFEQLASEQLQSKDVRGFARFAWHKTHRLNEAFDALVYATAIASLPNILRPISTAPAAPRKSVAEMAAQLNRLHNSTQAPTQRTF